jgi:hypothetical protein
MSGSDWVQMVNAMRRNAIDLDPPFQIGEGFLADIAERMDSCACNGDIFCRPCDDADLLMVMVKTLAAALFVAYDNGGLDESHKQTVARALFHYLRAGGEQG